MPIGCAVTATVSLEFWLNAVKGLIDPSRGTNRQQLAAQSDATLVSE